MREPAIYNSSLPNAFTFRPCWAAVGMATVMVSFIFATSARGKEDSPPNVVLIMTDDQGWGDVHSHGNDQIDSPVLDSLALQGARFDRFFVCPVCAPTRAGLLTGRYHLRTATHGVTRGEENMRADEVTVAEVFKNAGYTTGCFGKWHNGAHYPHHPNGQGFDEFIGFCAGHWNNYFDTQLEHNGQPFRSKGYITDVLVGAATRFITKNRKRPFFCYVPLNAPHSPWQVPDKYFDKYKTQGLDDKTACAYAMCENIDFNIGILLKKLDDLKLADNTIVIFTTDNGPNSNRYNGDMKGRKGSVDEGGVRVPLFVRWPKHIRAGLKVDPIAANIDMLPTLVDLCGIPTEESLPPTDGRSVAPLLLEQDVKWADRELFTFRRTGELGAVRNQQWRAVLQRNKQWALYDMAADPGQKKNIAADQRAVVKRLSDLYQAKLKDVSKAGFETLPIQVGHDERPAVTLPGHEAFLEPSTKKGISYLGRNGWANDWITNWTDTDAYPWWEVEVVQAGKYKVALKYVCSKANVGSRLRVEVGGKSVEGRIEKAHDPQPIPSPDRVPRGEVYEKTWATLELGEVELRPGRTRLAVKALSKPGPQVVDLKAVQLRKVVD